MRIASSTPPTTARVAPGSSPWMGDEGQMMQKYPLNLTENGKEINKYTLIYNLCVIYLVVSEKITTFATVKEISITPKSRKGTRHNESE